MSRDAAHVLDVAQFDAPFRQNGPGYSHVLHDKVEAFDRASDLRQRLCVRS